MMKKYYLLFLLIVLIALSGCQSTPSKEAKKKEEKHINSVKTYTSIEDYSNHIGSNMSTDKPKFRLEKQKLIITFNATFTSKMEKKMLHTKKKSYYAISEKEGNHKLDKLINKDDLPVYRNDLQTLAQDLHYHYKVVMPIKKQLTKKEKGLLLDGSNYVFLFLNEHKKITNVMDFLDIGLP
ncbi:hypothetical protein K2V03_002142 [Listeria innocua]|nr:hypothetical protein [Listeria innocua]EIU0523732.1 hypothetical protein [Listeria innocua]